MSFRTAPLLLLSLGLLLAGGVAGPRSASAAGGDVFTLGTRYCATTHPNHGSLDGYGPALDLGGPDDAGWPVHAPGSGRVRVYSTGWGDGWGNSIIWIAEGGGERIHLAHLASFGATGPVEAGERIGRVGSSGRATSPHLHASARRDGAPAGLVLGGRELRAGRCYTSIGPVPPQCLGQPATLVGTPGDDVLSGGDGNDVIVGLDGADRIDGGGGRDLVCGGSGPDRLVGGLSGDSIAGGGGPDVVRGGRGVDRLAGGRGDDALHGAPGDDSLDGGDGTDHADGGDGTDSCAAESQAGCEVDLTAPAP